MAESLFMMSLPGRSLASASALREDVDTLTHSSVEETSWVPWLSLYCRLPDDTVTVPGHGELTRMMILKKAFEATGQPRKSPQLWLALGDELTAQTEAALGTPRVVCLKGDSNQYTAKDAYAESAKLSPNSPTAWMKLAMALGPLDSVKMDWVRLRRADCLSRALALERMTQLPAVDLGRFEARNDPPAAAAAPTPLTATGPPSPNAAAK
jgi:hypothetical protein